MSSLQYFSVSGREQVQQLKEKRYRNEGDMTQTGQRHY